MAESCWQCVKNLARLSRNRRQDSCGRRILDFDGGRVLLANLKMDSI